MRPVLTRILFLSLACGLPGCTVDSAPLIADDISIIKPMPGAPMGAAYLTLTNTTDQPITITKVTSPDFASIEMHESYLEGGISRMRRLAATTIPPGKAIAFERGARHLMLMEPTGSGSDVTLQFFSNDVLTLSVNAIIEN